MRVHPFQTNLTAGELTPKLFGQTDFKKYNNGVEIMENMTVFPQGGASRRYGTRYVAPVKDATKNVRLIPFEFNVEQAYILEFGDQYIRFFKDNGAILEADIGIAAITQANPAEVSTAIVHNYNNGDEITISGVSGMEEVNTDRFLVANQTPNTFELQNLDGTNVDSTGFSAYTSGGDVNRIYEVSTNITEDMLYEIQFTQSADIMYIVHEDLPPQKLSRTGHTSWTLAAEEFENGPYLDKNTTSTTMNLSAHTVGTNRTLNVSSTTGVNGGAGFSAGDVGSVIRFRSGYVLVTAFVNNRRLTVDVKKDTGSTSSSTDWSLGAWSGYNGYPRTVSFFEQRLVFAGSKRYPQTVWGSQTGVYTDFDVGDSDAADAFIYTIAANKVNVIRWLSPARDLVVGTVGGEFKVSRPAGEPLKPTNVSITQQTTYGGWTTEPIQIGNVILFVQKQRRKVREFTYQFEDDAYAAPDMTLLADHITGTGIVDVAYAQEPESIYWAVRDDGILLGMTYKREEDVVGWHRHIIGGYNSYTFAGTDITTDVTDALNNGFINITAHGYETGDEVVYDSNGNTDIVHLKDGNTYYVYVRDADNIELAATYKQALDRTVVQIGAGTGDHIIKASAKAKSVASISEDKENQVWLVVERTVQNKKVKYIEYLDNSLNVDSGLTGLVNGASSQISNLNHLEGETVNIVIGDAVYPSQTVTNGNITVNLPSTAAYKRIEIGLPYKSRLKTLRVEAGARGGTAQARKKRYNEVAVRLFETVGVTINGDQVPFRTSSTPMGQNIQPFTGDKRVANLGWDREGQIIIEQDQPLPMTVLGLTGTLVTSE